MLYIVVDDMGIADVGCFGNKSIATPNVDRLCKVEVVPSLNSSKMTYPTLQGGFLLLQLVPK